MKINVNLSEEQNLLNLIKKGKNVTLTLDDVSFGTPEAHGNSPFIRLEPNKRPIQPNTRVLVTAKASSTRYKDSAYFNWRRLDLANQWKLLTKKNSLDLDYDDNTFVSFTEEHIKQYVQERMPVITTSVNYNVTINGEEATATVTPIDNSLCYYGNLVLKIKKKATEKTPISTVIPNPTNGDGFEYHTTHDVDGVVNGRGFIYSSVPTD